MAAKSANVTEEDKVQLILQYINDYIGLCEKSFNEHKFECATAGLTIGHTIISEFLMARVKNNSGGSKNERQQ